MADPYSNYAEGVNTADWGAAAAAWNAAKGRMATNYAGAGFGPTVTAKYQRKIQAASYHAPDVQKAIRNFNSRMRE
jgi:hypothetical protein